MRIKRARVRQQRQTSHTAGMPVLGRRSIAGVDLIIYAVLLVAVWVVYWQVRGYGLLDFDDLSYVTDNPVVKAGLSLNGVRWAFTHAYEGYWSPLTWLSYALDSHLFGQGGGSSHVTNVVLHAASACLLFAVLLRSTGARWPSACVAMLFAIHPLHVESVAWVAERKDVLSGFFSFVTIWTYLLYVERPRVLRYTFVVAAFVCGLMSKPMVVTLPLILLLLDLWPLGRLSTTTDIPRATIRARPVLARTNLAALLLEKAPLAALSLVVAAVTLATQTNAGAVPTFDAMPLLTRVQNALVSCAIYLLKMFWPSELAPLYPHPLAVPAWQPAAAALVLAGISVLVLRRARQSPHLLVGWLWYLITLVPVLGIVQAGVQARADRYTYVSMTGITIMVAWTLAERIRASPVLKRALAVATCVTISIFGVLAWQQVQYWRNSETLFRRAIAVTSGNYVAYAGLGLALIQSGRLDDGIANCREAVRINPRYAVAHSNLAKGLLEMKQPEEALVHSVEAVRLNPADGGSRMNRAAALSALGKINEAAAEYREAVQLAPSSAAAHSGLGAILAEQGRMDEALTELSESTRLDPGYAVGHYNLGALLARLGREVEAVAQFSEATRLNPGDADAHLSLGTALAKLGRMDQAIAELSTGTRLKPEDAAAHSNLGGALASAGRLDEAIVEFSMAVRLRPDLQEFRDNLALALTLRGKL
jgi:tetratricopeptide (TPR) repeat protein